MTQNQKRTGGCACGAIRYEVMGDPIRATFCHCRDCQRASGAPFLSVAVYPVAQFKIVKGEPTWYGVPRTKGGENRRGFCGICGSRLFSGNDGEIMGVMAGSFDDPSWFRPMAHIFVPHAQPWDPMAPDLPTFDTYYQPPKK